MDVVIGSETYTVTGTVSGATYTLFGQFNDIAGTRRQYITFTLSESTSGSGIVNWIVTDSTGQVLLCEGTTEFTIEKQGPFPFNGGGGDGACFIATAAYGSPVERHVTILEDFRDTYLLSNAVGRIIVKAYYKYSPPLARCIAKHETLKAAVRIGLMPLVAISYATRHFGPTVTLTMLIMLLIIPIPLVWLFRRKAPDG
jgi:hypothetical protein